MVVENTGTAEYIVVQKLASHFKVKKDELYKEVRQQQEERGDKLVYAPSLYEKYDFFFKLRCIQAPKLNLEDILNYKKFIKTKIYQDFVQYEPDDKHCFAMALVLVGTVWLIYRSKEVYDGSGAIILNDSENFYNSIRITPIQNYLSDEFSHKEQ